MDPKGGGCAVVGINDKMEGENGVLDANGVNADERTMEGEERLAGMMTEPSRVRPLSFTQA